MKFFSFCSNRMKNSELFTKKTPLVEEPSSIFCGHFRELKACNMYLRFFRTIPYKFMTPSGIFWSCLCQNFKYFGGKINITCLPKVTVYTFDAWVLKIPNMPYINSNDTFNMHHWFEFLIRCPTSWVKSKAKKRNKKLTLPMWWYLKN